MIFNFWRFLFDKPYYERYRCEHPYVWWDIKTDKKKSLDRTCSKCGSDDIVVQYHLRDVGPIKSCGYSDIDKSSGEHLHFYCRTCGYDWTEDTKDKEQSQ